MVAVHLTVGIPCPAADCSRAFQTAKGLALHVEREHAEQSCDIFGCLTCGVLYADEDTAAECCDPSEER